MPRALLPLICLSFPLFGCMGRTQSLASCGDSVCQAAESCALCSSDCGDCPVDGTDVTLAWDAPTTRTDGSPLSDLQGFRLYVDTAAPVDGSGGTELNVGNVTQFTVSLAPGSHAVAVNAYDVNGMISDYSNTLTLTLP